MPTVATNVGGHGGGPLNGETCEARVHRTGEHRAGGAWPRCTRRGRSGFRRTLGALASVSAPTALASVVGALATTALGSNSSGRLCVELTVDIVTGDAQLRMPTGAEGERASKGKVT